MITASSQASGRISGVTTTASGEATWAASGTYTGARDILVTVQIDSVSAGKEIGQATFSWKTSETVSGWEATGVTTSATAITLGTDGKKIAWVAGTGNDFEDADTGTFWCYASFGVENLLDLDRNTYWMSTGDASESLVIDLGSAKLVTAFVLLDHNLTSGATLTLQGHTANSWSSPSYSVAQTVGDPIASYLSETYQYWRVLITDASNPDGYLKIGDVYLGTYTELVATFARITWGSGVTRKRNMVENEAETGRRTQRIWSKQRVFDFRFDTLDATDEATLYGIWDGIHDTSSGAVTPLFVHYFQDVTKTLMLCRMISDYDLTYTSFGIHKSALKFEEVAKTR